MELAPVVQERKPSNVPLSTTGVSPAEEIENEKRQKEEEILKAQAQTFQPVKQHPLSKAKSNAAQAVEVAKQVIANKATAKFKSDIVAQVKYNDQAAKIIEEAQADTGEVDLKRSLKK